MPKSKAVPTSAPSPASSSTDLLDRLSVEKSPIDGKGLFATQRIFKGKYIGEYAGPVAKQNGKYVLWVTEADGSENGRRGLNKLRFLNHSKKPNTEFDGFELYAIRAIRPGDELTFDYGWEE